MPSWRPPTKIARFGVRSGSVSQRHGSGSVPECHGSATLDITDVTACCCLLWNVVVIINIRWQYVLSPDGRQLQYPSWASPGRLCNPQDLDRRLERGIFKKRTALLWKVLKNQCWGSGMFIPDPNYEKCLKMSVGDPGCLSRIRIFSIPDPHQII